MRNYIISFILFFLSYQECKPQGSFDLKNQSLGRAYEDSTLFKGKVKNLKHYKLLTKDVEEYSYYDTKKINNKTYYLSSNTDYGRDKRILKKSSHEVFSKAKGYQAYYYDNNNLKIIRPESEENKYGGADIFWYDDRNNLTEVFDYRTYPGKDFDYQNYYKLNYEYKKEGTYINELHYGYDTLALPDVKFYNLEKKLIKRNNRITKEEFKDYKKGRELMKRSLFYEGELLNQTVYNRDEKGYLLEKIENSYKPNKYVEYETYTYEDNYNEEIRQTYSTYKGNHKKQSILRKKVDTEGNIIKEGYIDRNGDGFYRYYEYEYDLENNWIKKTEYYQSVRDYNIEKKEFQKEDLREIIYYEENEIENISKVPDIDPRVFEIKKQIPIWAEKKQKAIDQYKVAKENGEYDNQILVKTAKTIKEFTPKLWEILVQTSGDLDGDGISEVVVVYNTPIDNVDYGEDRVLAVFRKNKNNWELWEQSRTAIEPKSDGMINEFGTINIKNNCIIVNHYGVKSEVTTWYRYQNNDWFLIGYKQINWSPSNNFSKTDYNLNTGRVISVFENNQEIFSNEEEKGWSKVFFYKLKELPLMKTYKIFENTIKIKIPNSEHKIGL